jgi:hypothetical protein
MLASTFVFAAFLTFCCESHAAPPLDDKDKILSHLAESSATKYLQKNGNKLERMKPKRPVAQNVVMYQKFSHGHPILGARVSVKIDDSGKVESVDDDNTTQELKFGSDTARLKAEAATELVGNLYMGELTAVSSEAKLVWFRSADTAKLAWQVDTVVADQPEEISPTSLHTTLDAMSGELLSQYQLDNKTYGVEKGKKIGMYPRRIVINDSFGTARSRAYGAETPFRAVVSLGFNNLATCTGTLIAPTTVISARHCNLAPGDSVWFGHDSTNPIYSTTILSVSLPGGAGSMVNGTDVAILRLRNVVPAAVATPMRLIGETELVGRNAAFAGFGLNGAGNVGHQGTRDGFRWAGDNTIDFYGADPLSGEGSNLISTDFDDGSAVANSIPGSSPTPLQREATTASGDSGGPLMLNINGEPVLAGVLSGGSSLNSQYGDVSYWAGTAIFRTQIQAAGGEFVTEPKMLEFEYTLKNIETNQLVPRVDLPGNRSGYRIYNHHQYSMNVIALQVSPNPSTRITQLGFTGDPLRPDLAIGDSYSIRYDEGWDGDGFVTSASSPQFFLAENDSLNLFDVPVFRDADGQAEARFGSTSTSGMAFFLGSVEPMEIPIELMEVRRDNYAATDSWQNRDYPGDVNNSGCISPIDAVLVINVLHDNNLESSIVPFEQPENNRLIDVNGDSSISPVDAILVINELNEQ